MGIQDQESKNNIWFFGDSFTLGDGCIKERPLNGEYFKLNPHGVLWTNGVADHFNMNAINKSEGGTSNDWIINSLIIELLNIKPNDIVVLGLSFPERFQLIDKKDKIHRNHLPHQFTGDGNPMGIVLDEKDSKYSDQLFKMLKLFVMEYRIQPHDLLMEYHLKQASNLLKKIEQDNVRTLLWNVPNKPLYETIHDLDGSNDKHWSWKGHNSWMKKCISLLENNVNNYRSNPQRDPHHLYKRYEYNL